MTRKIAAAGLVAIGCSVLLALPASAHITVNPDSAPKGGFTKLTFRVPNERDDASTTKLEVSFPVDHPIPFVSVKPHPGWTATVEKTKLATPVTSEDGDKTTEAVSKITWSGGAIKAGEFDEFDVSVGPLPSDVDQLVFKALQTYDKGEVVRWIEEAGPDGKEPDHPAPVLKLTAAAGEVGTAGETTTTVTSVEAGGEVEPLRGVPTEKDVDSIKRTSGAALAVGVAAALMALYAMVRGRRSTSSRG